jgi:hypothetical protein
LGARFGGVDGAFIASAKLLGLLKLQRRLRLALLSDRCRVLHAANWSETFAEIAFFEFF